MARTASIDNKAIVDIRLRPRYAMLPPRRGRWWTRPTLAIMCRCVDQSDSQLLEVLRLSGTCFPPPKKILPIRDRDLYPMSSHTLFLGPSPLIIPNGISIGSAVVMSFKCYAVQCTVNGEENPQKLPFLLGFCHRAGGSPSHGHKQHAHTVCECGFEDILADRQTHTHTLTQT